MNEILSEIERMNRITEPLREFDRVTRRLSGELEIARHCLTEAGLGEQIRSATSLGAEHLSTLQMALEPSIRLTRAVQEANASAAMQELAARVAMPPGIDELHRDWERISQAVSTQVDLRHSAIAGLGVTPLVEEFARSCLNAADRMRDLAGVSDYATSLGFRIVEGVATSVRAMETGLLRPGRGLLLGRERAGLLSWMGGDAVEPAAHGATWLSAVNEPHGRRDDGRKSIIVACKARCRICGGLLVSEHAELQLNADYDLELGVFILPLCIECMRQDSEEVGFARPRSDLAAGSESPALQLIDGGEEGDGRGRGRLLLVSRRSERDAPRDE